jgi:pyruvate-ferredoxin/flavodoxin oxidoreductase
MSEAMITVDGNEAVARVAYRLNEVIAIYPITPASPMGEWADAWASQEKPNLWGSVPSVVELQSEAGAAGTVHGALQAGALTTTFTASQGLLLMIPNLYKLAGELTPAVLHVAARSLAAQGLSIFGDHSDVMACRGTGCAILCSASVQEAADFAAIATRASLRGRLPFLHMFDGFRTSHEIQKVTPISDAVLRALIPGEAITAHRRRALSPDHPVIRGTAQNPDVYFQARESVNRFHDDLPGHVQEAMAAFAAQTGRTYHPFEFIGAPDAERVLLLMGSGCETAEETVASLTAAGERVGVLKVRLYRPFAPHLLVAALPRSVRAIAVLDRCKEPGAGGEPLYLDVVAALAEAWTSLHPDRPLPLVLGGRYGLSSKEFTPAMVKAVFHHLSPVPQPGAPTPLNHFTVGILDDVTHRSLPVDDDFVTEREGEVRAVFYGLGSDGTVGANKSTIKIIGESTPLFAQGYFVYDSKKSGSVTVSHLRFGPRPIHSTYLIQRPTLVACHQWDFVDRFDLLAGMAPGGVLLLNSPYEAAECWDRLPAAMRRRIRELNLKVWLINAYRVARQAGMGPRINTVMQACFFAVSGVLPREEAIERIRASIRKTYGRKGDAVVAMNLKALDATLDHLLPLDWADLDDAPAEPTPVLSPLQAAPAFVKEVIGPMLERRGDELPVSALPCDGTWPVGTAKWEKRNIADSIPVWESDLCVQCGKCVMVCPHAVIRAKAVDPQALAAAPEGFRHAPARDPAFAGQSFTIQVAAEDCTGCNLCVEVCPARDRTEPKRKAINMAPQRPLRDQARGHWDFFLQLPEVPAMASTSTRSGSNSCSSPCSNSPAPAEVAEKPLISSWPVSSSVIACSWPMPPAAPRSTAATSPPPPGAPTTRDVDPPGATPCSKTTPNSVSACGWRWTSSVRWPWICWRSYQPLRSAARMKPLLEAMISSDAPAFLPPALVEAISRADQSDEAGIFAQRQRVADLKRLLQAQPEVSNPSSKEPGCWSWPMPW